MREIKLFMTDVDGVWTDGGMIYDEGTGNELKRFNVKDGVGVILLRSADIPTAILTGENTEIVARRARKLKIDNCFLGVKNKVAVAEKLLEQLGISWEETAFIGDEINDISIIKKVGLSACPSDAAGYVKDIVDVVLTKKGGEGAFKEFVEFYFMERGELDQVVDKVVEEMNV